MRGERAAQTLFSGLTWVLYLALPGRGLFSVTLQLCHTSALGAEHCVACCSLVTWLVFGG